MNSSGRCRRLDGRGVGCCPRGERTVVPAGVWEMMGLCVEERECKLRESGECSCERGDTLARGGTAQYAQRREMRSLGVADEATKPGTG